MDMEPETKCDTNILNESQPTSDNVDYYCYMIIYN